MKLNVFKSIYAQQTMHTLDFLNMLSKEQWQAISHNSDALFLGTRVNKLTVSALVKHLIIAERHWINAVNSLPVGSTIPIPGNTALLDNVPDGTELMESYRKALEENKQLLSDLTEEDHDGKSGKKRKKYYIKQKSPVKNQ